MASSNINNVLSREEKRMNVPDAEETFDIGDESGEEFDEPNDDRSEDGQSSDGHPEESDVREKKFYSPESGKERLSSLNPSVIYWIDSQPSVSVYRAVLKGIIFQVGELAREMTSIRKTGENIADVLMFKKRWLGMMISKLKMSTRIIFGDDSFPNERDYEIPSSVLEYVQSTDPVKLLQTVIDVVQQRSCATRDKLENIKAEKERVSQNEFRELQEKTLRLNRVNRDLIDLLKECDGSFRPHKKSFANKDKGPRVIRTPNQERPRQHKPRTNQYPNEQYRETYPRETYPREQYREIHPRETYPREQYRETYPREQYHPRDPRKPRHNYDDDAPRRPPVYHNMPNPSIAPIVDQRNRF